MTDYTALTVRQLADGFGSGDFTACQVTAAYLEAIRKKEAAYGAYLTVTGELALSQARAVDEARAQGAALPPLAGIPMGVKDNICTQGVRTTCASRMLEDFVPPYSATVMERLQGAVMLGKLNMDEFAMGSTTESSYFHPTRNPVDTTRVPGGSSGGSAAAVAAGEAAFALGSDTGGSIRQPAAFCGVVGMKPTYGSVSRYGLIAFASSLDQIGPITRNVTDNALVLESLVGRDPRDATSVDCRDSRFTQRLEEGVRGLSMALPMDFLGEGVAPAVRQAVLDAAQRYARLGAEIVEVSLPVLRYALPAYYVISSAEASSNLARFDGVRYGHRAEEYRSMEELYCASRSEGFGAEVKRRILLGTFALSAGYYDAYYKKALQVRTLMIQAFNRIFERCPVILSPVAPTTAYRLGEKLEDPLQMYMGDIFTVPANIAGLPAMSLPCGHDGDGLPIGLGLLGRPFDEATLYRAAFALEQAGRHGGQNGKGA